MRRKYFIDEDTPVTTLEQVREVVARMKLHSGAIPIENVEVRNHRGQPLIVVTVTVPERDTGSPFKVYHTLLFGDGTVRDLSVQYFNLLRQVYMHEFEELYHLDGVRVLDPHDELPPETAHVPEVVR